MEEHVISLPSVSTAVAARLGGQAKPASSPTHVLPIHVQMGASAQRLIPPTSAPAHPPSTVKPANKMSTSVPRRPLPVSMVVCVCTRWAHTTAAVLKSTLANTVRPPTCHAVPHHARMEAPVCRRETPPMIVAACQASQVRTVSITSMTVQATTARMVVCVWMV